MKRFLPGRWKGEGGGVDRKRLLGHANALAEMYQRPGEPGEAGGVKRVAAVGVWFQKAGKGMEGLSTGSDSSGAPETLKGVKSAHAPSGGGYVAAWLRFQMVRKHKESFRQETTFQGGAFGWERWNAGEIA